MNGARYAAEFKAEAIKHVTERGHGVIKVSKLS
jgi:transposase